MERCLNPYLHSELSQVWLEYKRYGEYDPEPPIHRSSQPIRDFYIGRSYADRDHEEFIADNWDKLSDYHKNFYHLLNPYVQETTHHSRTI